VRSVAARLERVFGAEHTTDGEGCMMFCALTIVLVIAVGYGVALWAALTGRLVAW